MILALLCALALADDPTVVEAVEPVTIVGPDRSRPPEVLPPTPMALPEWEVHDPWSGMRVLLVPLAGARKVELTLYRHRGMLDLEGRPTVAGYATGWLQDVATADRSAAEIEVFESLRDLDVWSGSLGFRQSELGLSVPRGALAEGLDLLADVARSPAYPRRDVALYARDKRLYLTSSGPSSPSDIASDALSYAWYPADHPYGARPDPRALRRLSRRDLSGLHARMLAESPVTLLVVGDLSWDALGPMLAARLAGLGVPGEEGPQPEVVPPAASRVVAVDMPGAEQAVVHLRLAAPDRHHPDADGFAAVDWAFGGHFLSRINENLREDKGLTYGARSGYARYDGYGDWVVSFDVAAPHVGVAIGEVGAEIDEIVADGINVDELSAWWKERVRYWNLSQQTASSALGRYRHLFVAELSSAEARARLVAGGEIAPAVTQQVAARWLGSDQPRVWVIVGDRQIIAPQLAEIGLQPEWISPASAIAGDF